MARTVSLLNQTSPRELIAPLILPQAVPLLDSPDVFVICAAEDGVPLGAAAVELCGDFGELRSIAVVPDRQREKIGTALLWETLRTLNLLSCRGMSAILPRGETAAAGLLRSFGMAPADVPSVSYTFTLAQFAQQLPKSSSLHTHPLEDIPDHLLTVYALNALQDEAPLLDREQFEPRISRVIADEDADELQACLMVERNQQGLYISWLQIDGDNKLSPVYLLQDAVAEAQKLLPPETVIRLLANTPSVVRLIDRLVGPQARTAELDEWVLADIAFRSKPLLTRVWEVDDHV